MDIEIFIFLKCAKITQTIFGAAWADPELQQGGSGKAAAARYRCDEERFG